MERSTRRIKSRQDPSEHGISIVCGISSPYCGNPLYTASSEMPWRKWRVYSIACFRSETCNDVSLAAIPRVRDPSGAEEKFRFPFAVYDRGRIAAEHGSCYTGDGRRGSCSLRFSLKAVISVVILLKQRYYHVWKGAGRLYGLGSISDQPV